MNKPRQSVLVILVFLGLSTATWYWGFRSTEEDRIRGRIAELEHLVSSPPSPGLMGKAKTIAGFRDLLTNPARIESRRSPVTGVRSPDEIGAAFLGATGAGDEVDLVLSPQEILFSADDRATVDVVVRATLTRSGNQAREYSGNALFRLRKTVESGSWKFESFEEIP